MTIRADSSVPPARLQRLPTLELAGGLRVAVASTLRARTLGLAGLRQLSTARGLLIPRCASVHTFGMRFELDLLFLNASGELLLMREGVRPLRVSSRPGADAVLEVSVGAGRRFARETPLSCAALTYP